MKYLTFIIILLSCSVVSLHAQELNARLTVNSDRIEGSNKDIFTSLQQSLNEFVNGKKWSGSVFSTTERIECSFTITILAQTSDNMFKAELSVIARRPVFNSSYVTTTLNFRDTNLEFDYVQNAPLEYVENTVNNNLVSVIAYYAYLILGLDFDSFSPLGGSYFFREAQRITMQSQSLSQYTGWSAFDSPGNRNGIISAFMDEASKPYRELWYTYHRRGLDEMAANADRGRTTIIQALPALDQYRNNRTLMILLQLFSDTKLEEVVQVCSKATIDEKKEVYDLLLKIYPTVSDRLAPLQK